MTKLSDRMYVLADSETLAMSKKSAELKAQGFDIINLSIGEPDFNTPELIKQGAKKAIDDNYTHYPPVAGYKDLREAISRKFKKENNLDFAQDQIVVSAGAKHSIANVVLCLVNPGEEVIIPSPYWVSYREIIKLAEGTGVFIKTSLENDFKITAKQLESAITPKTKMFIFSSPSNPTGFIYTKDELKAIAEVIAKHENIYVISDEIYEHINYVGKHESIAQFDSIKDRVIVINGVSKGYAMTGWRIGYIGAPKWLAQACEKLQGQFTSAACSIAQRASLTALTCDQSAVGEMREIFRKRRDLVISHLKEIPAIKTNTPQGAFYVFADFSYYFGKSDGTTKIKDANDLTFWLLEKAQVAMVSGDAFGDPNCIRLSYATSDELLIKAVQRIKDALGKLK
ncbi:MAG: pyridoxal phosphate-dependent aminotransferase [Bacteroidales bacterium]|jgi:aspartate aminotransferase